MVKTLLAQAGVPAGKKMLTEVSNILADTMAMGNRSKLAEAARRYEEYGLSQKEAWFRATMDSLSQVGWAGAKGLASAGANQAMNGMRGVFQSP